MSENVFICINKFIYKFINKFMYLYFINKNVINTNCCQECKQQHKN